MSEDISRRSLLRAGSVAAPLAVSGCLGELVMNEYGEGSDGTSETGGAEPQTEDAVDATGNESAGGNETAEAPEDTGSDVTADASSTFAVKEATNYIDVFITAQGEADYFDIEITGDAQAKGRLYRRGDRFRLTPYSVQTVNNAENLTTWRSDQFNGAQMGDQITVTVKASIDGVSTVVHERTDILGPSEVRADLNYIFDKTNNKVHVILTDPGNADHVNVRFEGGGSGVLAKGKLHEPGDELVVGNVSIDNRPEDKWSHELQLINHLFRFNETKAAMHLKNDSLDPNGFDYDVPDSVDPHDVDISAPNRDKLVRKVRQTDGVSDDIKVADMLPPPGAAAHGHAELTIPNDRADDIVDEDETWIGKRAQIRINGTAVIEGRRAKGSVQTRVLDVTGDLSELQEIEP